MKKTSTQRGTARRNWVLASGVTMALLVAGCSGSPNQSPTDVTADGPEVTSINYGIVPIATFTPLYAAVELGYFQDEGIEEVKFQTASGGSSLLQLVLQGELQFTILPAEAAINAQAQDLPVSIVPSPTRRASSVAPDATTTLVRSDSDIATLQDLEGKTVAVNAVQGLNWVVQNYLLEEAGVDPDSVEYVEVPFPDMNEALMGGSVDAVIGTQPFVHQAEETGSVRVLDYPFVTARPGMMTVVFGAVAQSWASEHPKTVAAVQRALNRAVDYMEENPEEALELVAEFTELPLDLVRELPSNSWSSEPLEQDDLDWLVSQMVHFGVLDEPISVSDMLWSPEG